MKKREWILGPSQTVGLLGLLSAVSAVAIAQQREPSLPPTGTGEVTVDPRQEFDVILRNHNGQLEVLAPHIERQWIGLDGRRYRMTVGARRVR